MALLAQLRQPIDTFFERVLVNDADQTLRRNRLALLSEFTSTMLAIADFSRVEVRH
jgi:glycyl-tRNA synthetase beta chain